MDHVMAGIEAVAGGLQKHVLLESIKKFDEDHTKKWLIRSDAEDILTMRLAKISLDEHIARLYGPTVLATQTSRAKVQPSDPEEARRRLKKAFSKSVYERYRNRALAGDDSLEQLTGSKRLIEKKPRLGPYFWIRSQFS